MTVFIAASLYFSIAGFCSFVNTSNFKDSNCNHTTYGTCNMEACYNANARWNISKTTPCLTINSGSNSIAMIQHEQYNNIVLDYMYTISKTYSNSTATAGIIWYNHGITCSNYYYIGISYLNNSVFLAQAKNSTTHLLYNASLPFNYSLGTFYRLQCIISYRNTFTISVNNITLLTNITDKQLNFTNFSYFGMKNTESKIIAKSFLISGSATITINNNTIKQFPTCQPTISPTPPIYIMTSESPSSTWNICEDNTECAYIAKIIFLIKWSSVYNTTFVATTTDVFVDIISDAIISNLKPQISINNIRINVSTDSLNNTLNGESKANVMIATNDKDIIYFLFKQINETQHMMNNISILLTYKVIQQYKNISFNIIYIDGIINLIKPDTMSNDKRKHRNDLKEFSFVIIIVCLLLSGYFCNRCRKHRTKRRRSFSHNKENWSPSSRFVYSVRNKHKHIKSYSFDNDEIDVTQNSNKFSGKVKKDIAAIELTCTSPKTEK